MELWLPGYEHDPENGAGIGIAAGATKVVIHTTETPPGSWQGVRNMWRGGNNWGRGLPHFLAEGDRYVQLLPFNVNAYTLANPPGPPDTNRSGLVVQVEIVHYAANPFSDVEYEALGRWLADMVKAGLPINVSEHPQFLGAGDGVVLASANSPIRLSAGAYDAFNGWLGHQHVPQNDHWDPGKLDGNRVESIIQANLNGQPSPEEDMPLDQADKDFIVNEIRNAVRPVVLDTPGGKYLWDRGLPVPTGDVQVQTIANLMGAPSVIAVNNDFVGQLRTGVGCVSGGAGADAAAIAAAVVDQLGDDLARQVATELAARLAN